MTRATAQLLKDSGRYGSQGGLLGVAEMVELYDIAYRNAINVLEVGHFMGLSTEVLCRADSTNVVSIDAHIKDAWVNKSDPQQYFDNLKEHHRTGKLQTFIMDSRGVQRIDGFDFVFYDGDHAEEQERWTRMVMDSKSVRYFVFDDRDFAVPRRCCELLEAGGWVNLSPQVKRLSGDKMNPETMTLGIFRRSLV